jgi:hypothetical protein
MEKLGHGRCAPHQYLKALLFKKFFTHRKSRRLWPKTPKFSPTTDTSAAFYSIRCQFRCLGLFITFAPHPLLTQFARPPHPFSSEEPIRWKKTKLLVNLFN